MMDQLTTVLSEDGVEALFDQVLKGFEHHIVGEQEMGYRCYCDESRVREAISCIDPAELKEMIAEGRDIRVHCQFCDKVYAFTPADLEAVLAARDEK